MLRVFEAGLLGLGFGRHFAAVGLVALGGALAPLVARKRKHEAAKRAESLEVFHLEVADAGYAAVYEDGKLVGVVEGVGRRL